MALSANCPSCGAPVVFKSAGSVFAVCAYCQSTLVRHDQTLEDIGKMAALVEDRSPLQLGSEGRYQGVHFALIGRIQIRYSQGLWNEWHLLFDDMRSGWLSEASGEYVLTFLKPAQAPIPAFADLQIGQELTLAGQGWTVSNREDAECVAGEGELPFTVGAGYPLPTVDLRCGERFATLDYSETPPWLFVGQSVDFAALKLSNLRDGMPLPGKAVAVEVFRCPACGAPLQSRSPQILAVACAACGAVIDCDEKNHQILSQALAVDAQQAKPQLPLGTQGRLDGKAVEVIGFLVRRSRYAGINYDWREYLLAGEHGQYRWLTEYDGHWNVVDVLRKPPAGSGAAVATVRYGGETFKHFATTDQAEVIAVAGEFTWRVARGECCRVVDYIAPPLMLSCEVSDQELIWSQGRYAEPQEIAAAFGLSSLPAARGIYANQPNPWVQTHRGTCRRFWLFALLALIVQLGVWLGLNESLLRQEFLFSPEAAGSGESVMVTHEFQVRDKPRKLVVSNQTTLDNHWLTLDLTLINKDTGAAWPAQRDLAYYYGSDDGESWSEGSRDDEVVFLDIPPGTYYLTVDPEIAPEKPVAVRDTLTVTTGEAGWSNFILLLLFLLIFPVFSRLRLAAFESGRWAESDHAPADSDDGDDD